MSNIVNLLQPALLIWPVLAWAIITTILFFRNPLPLPDRGHRLFGVHGREAQDLLISILSTHGLRLNLRFKTGPTIQALLADNMTVIHDVARDFGATGNGVSVVVKDPRAAASEAVTKLRAAGYQAESSERFSEFLPPNHLVVVESQMFNGWALVFRRHVLRMPRPERIP